MVFLKGRASQARFNEAEPVSRQPRAPVQPTSRLFDSYEDEAAPAPVNEDVLDLCRSLRHACSAFEAALDRHDHASRRAYEPEMRSAAAAHGGRFGEDRDRAAYAGRDAYGAEQGMMGESDMAPHRARPRYEPRDEARHESRAGVAAAPAAISMRDMTDFLLSREGERFLSLIRRMIREEMQDGAAQGPQRRGEEDGAGLERVRLARAEQRRFEEAQAERGSLRDILRRDITQRELNQRDANFRDTGLRDHLRARAARRMG